jgi:hypothetical protein
MLVVLASSVQFAGATTMAFTGTARHTDGTLLYREIHKVEGLCQQGVFHPQTDKVTYQKPPDNRTFARKTLRYEASLLRPGVDFKQPDAGESMVITYPRPGRVSVFWEQEGKSPHTFNLNYSGELVVDAGFDNLVRKHWQELTGGKPVTFSFLAPTRGESYQFILEPIEHPWIETDYTFQIRPASTFLGFLVDPITLGYSKRGALTDYLGLTNIRKNRDTNYTAHIHYMVNTWPECELTP